MTREEFLLNKINNRYDTVKDFAREIGLPYSTLRDLIKRFNGSSVSNAIKVCNTLNIKVEDVWEYDE